MALYWGTGRLGTHQNVAFSSSAGTIGTALYNGQTVAGAKVRVVTTTAAFIKIGKSPTATSSDVYMPADSPEYFTCNSGESVSAIQVASAGTLHVTEIP